MNGAQYRNWITGHQREIVLYGLLFLAGFQFGRVSGRHER